MSSITIASSRASSASSTSTTTTTTTTTTSNSNTTATTSSASSSGNALPGTLRNMSDSASTPDPDVEMGDSGEMQPDVMGGKGPSTASTASVMSVHHVLGNHVRVQSPPAAGAPATAGSDERPTAQRSEAGSQININNINNNINRNLNYPNNTNTNTISRADDDRRAVHPHTTARTDTVLSNHAADPDPDPHPHSHPQLHAHAHAHAHSHPNSPSCPRPEGLAGQRGLEKHQVNAQTSSASGQGASGLVDSRRPNARDPGASGQSIILNPSTQYPETWPSVQIMNASSASAPASTPAAAAAIAAAATAAPLPSIERDHLEMNSPQLDARPFEPSSPKHQRIPSTKAETIRSQADSIKLDKEIVLFKQALKQVSSAAAQAVLRDSWRVFLFGNGNVSEDHLSFLLRAGLKNADVNILDRVFKDDSIFKEPLARVVGMKPTVIAKALRHAQARQIIDNVPDEILDQVLVHHIKTAPATQLVNTLAKADRLGYKPDDIIDEDDECVTPNLPSQAQGLLAQAQAPMQTQTQTQPQPQIPTQHGDIEMTDAQPFLNLAQPGRDPLLAEQERNAAGVQQAKKLAHAARLVPRPPGAPLSCPKCQIQFQEFTGYNYHILKKVCEKATPADNWKWHCPSCMQKFSTKQGREYHMLKGVCRGEDIAPATTPSKGPEANRPQPARNPSDPVVPPVRPQFLTQAPPSQSQAQSHFTRPPSGQAPLPSPPSQAPPQYPGMTQYSAAPPPQPSSQAQSTNAGPPVPLPLQNQPQVVVPPPQSRGPIPRPPMHTPQVATPTPGPRRQAPPDDVRQSPADLPPHKLAELNRQLADADLRHQQGIADIPATFSEADKQAKLTSLKNANASRKSQIRKSFGVTLRMREKDKQYAKEVKKALTGASSSAIRPQFNTFKPEVATSARASPVGTPRHVSAPTTAGFSPINATTGFSPINTPARGGSSPQNHPQPYPPQPVNNDSPQSGYASPAPPAAPYGEPMNTIQRIQSQHHNTLSHAQENRASPSGFGVLKSSPQLPPLPTHPAPSAVTPSYASPYNSEQVPLAQSPSNPHKRRRSSHGDGRETLISGPPASRSAHQSQYVTTLPLPNSPSLGGSTSLNSGLSLLQLSAEDAAAKYSAKRSPVAAAQERWEALNGKPDADSAPAGSPGAESQPNDAAPNERRRSSLINGAGTKESAISIDSESESEKRRTGTAVTDSTPARVGYDAVAEARAANSADKGKGKQPAARPDTGYDSTEDEDRDHDHDHDHHPLDDTDNDGSVNRAGPGLDSPAGVDGDSGVATRGFKARRGRRR